MSFILDNWMLFLVALSSGAMLMLPTLSKGGASSLSATQAVQLMNREKAVVIDVCQPNEFAAGHLPNARSIPLGELEGKLASVAKNKSVPVIMVCASGMRSNRAVGIAKRLGYEKVFNLTGGLGAWKTANLPVEKG